MLPQASPWIAISRTAIAPTGCLMVLSRAASQVSRVGADPHQDRHDEPITPAFSAKTHAFPGSAAGRAGLLAKTFTKLASTSYGTKPAAIMQASYVSHLVWTS